MDVVVVSVQRRNAAIIVMNTKVAVMKDAVVVMRMNMNTDIMNTKTVAIIMDIIMASVMNGDMNVAENTMDMNAVDITNMGSITRMITNIVMNTVTDVVKNTRKRSLNVVAVVVVIADQMYLSDIIVTIWLVRKAVKRQNDFVSQFMNNITTCEVTYLQ